MPQDNMNKFWKVASIFLVFLSLFVFVEIVSVLKSYRYIGESVENKKTITFSGKGEVTAVPDIATFSFSVTEEGKTGAAAQSKATEKTNSALAVLKKLGIEDKDIQTLGYNVNPKYEYTNGVCTGLTCLPSKQNLVGYEATQTIDVKVRKIADAGTVLSEITTVGVNNISDLQLTVDKQDALEKEARQKAITDAKDKAASLANDLGITLTKIVDFNENGNYPIYARPMAASKAMDVGAEAAPQIPTGENKITSDVNITYEIE